MLLVGEPQDNQGDPTYTKGDFGFLVVNFQHKLPQIKIPKFILVMPYKFSFQMLLRNLDGKLYYAKELEPSGK